VKIGDRVSYPLPGLDELVYGTIVEPTEQEKRDRGEGMDEGDVMVAWEDGYRYWESPDDLTLEPEAGS
jgi:hypothetical protein